MATAKSNKKTATKRVAKKVEAPKPKRTYKRKPKVEQNAPMPPSEPMQAEAAGPNPNYVEPPRPLSMFDVNLLDMRGMTLPVKAMFLLELQSLGFVDCDLDPPAEAGLLSANYLRSIEVVHLNQQNKILTFRKYKDLTTEDGVITIPTAYSAGVVVVDAEKRMAAPEYLEVDGVKYSKVQ